MVLSKRLQLVNVMCIWEAAHTIIDNLSRIKINKALYGQVTGHRILSHQFQSNIVWFQIGLDEIVLSICLRKAVRSVSWYDMTWMAANMKETKCVFSSSKMVSMSSSYCSAFFLVVQISAEIMMSNWEASQCSGSTYCIWCGPAR